MMAASLFKKHVKYTPLVGEAVKGDGEVVSPLLPQYERIVERPVRQGETLRNISINYRISVSELKRINRLQNDSEFYALKDIKIPVKPHSALGDILQKEAEQSNAESCLANGSASTQHRSQLSSFTSNDTDDSDGESCVGYVSIQQILREKSTREEARRFLENMKADLTRIKEKVVSDKASLEDTAAALTESRFIPLTSGYVNGEAAGISWWRLFLGAIFLLLLLPITYLVYLFHFDQ